MSDSSLASPNLAQALWPATVGNRALRALLLAIAGSALLTLSAKIQVPFWPVPMTMQTFAVLVIAMAYGPRLGAGTVALYLAEGAAGLPVFANGGGFAYFAGPTAGYLIGFLVAAALIGWLGDRGWDRRVVTTLAAMALGTVVIFAFGVAWLSVLIGVAKAIAGGLTPFLLGAAFKIALAAAVLPLAWRLVRRD